MMDSSHATPGKSWENWRKNRQREFAEEEGIKGGGEGEEEPSPPPPPPPKGPPPPSSRKFTPTTSDLRASFLQRTNMARPSPTTSSPRQAGRSVNVVVDLSKSAGSDPDKHLHEDDDGEDWDIGEGLGPVREDSKVTANSSKDGSHITPPPPPPPPREKLPQGQPTIVDRAMELAVDRLAQVMSARGGDAILDDSVDTKRLLDDISAQVARLMKQERERTVTSNADDFDIEEGDDVNREDGATRDSRAGSEGSSRRPTPYDLWSKRSSAAKEGLAAPKSVKLSKEKWDGLVERLYASLRKHDIHIAATQQAIIAKELADVTFTPKINERSRKLASHSDMSIAERSALLEAEKARKIALERRRLAEKELEEATFRPRINEASKNLAGVNPRLYDSPFERREAAAKKATLEREAAERAQYTFSPMINPRSRELAVRGKALQMANSPARSEPSPRRNSDESFKPSINPHSRRLVAGSRDSNTKPIFERLYESAVEARRAHADEVTPTKRRGKAMGSPAVIVFRPGLEFILETLQKDLR